MFKDLMQRAKAIYKHERISFYLAAAKTATMLFTFFLLMFPFFVKDGYGDVVRYSILRMPLAFLFIPLWFISILAYLYFFIMKKEKEVKMLQFGQMVLSGVIFITLFIDFIVVSANTVSFINVHLGSGFFFSLIAVALIVLITIKESLLLELIMKVVKPQKEVISEVIEDAKPEATPTPPANE